MISRRAAFALPLALGGCSTISGWLTNPLVAAGIEEAISLAVGVVLNALGPNALSTAEELAALVTQLISAVSGTQTTLATLAADADAWIVKEKLPLAVTDALEDIVGLAASMLQSGSTVGAANTTGALSQVFTAIQVAAKLYVGAAGSPVMLKLQHG